MRGGSRPILVTGLPRSGTTWLARLLAMSPGTSMAGREPMNPRERQFALAGSLRGWTRLDVPSQQQRRVLRRVYRGWEPRVYGRFGIRPWIGPAPWSRVVVKDPFALLSLPTVATETRALPVLVYRHPGAVLASYRRMGWRADIEELAAVLPQFARGDEAGLNDLDAMGRAWSICHHMALDDLAGVSGSVVVDHGELAAAGVPALRRLFEQCGLTWGARIEREVRGWSERTRRGEAGHGLHDFNRTPELVAGSWRRHLNEDELGRIERSTDRVRRRLRARRMPIRHNS